MMASLLVVHHTTSPHLRAMFEAVMSGATDQAIEGVTFVARPALAATAIDVLEADGYLLGTPAKRPVRPRQQRHHRGGPGGRGDRAGSWMAPRAGSGERARRPG